MKTPRDDAEPTAVGVLEGRRVIVPASRVAFDATERFYPWFTPVLEPKADGSFIVSDWLLP